MKNQPKKKRKDKKKEQRKEKKKKRKERKDKKKTGRGRDDQIRDWQFHDINEILYRQKKKTIFHIMRYIQSRDNDIYTNEKRERDDQN